MMYWNGHMTTGGWIISILWTAIVIALVIALIVWLSSALSRPDRNASGGGSAREILDRRLARGELTVEEYEGLRDTLGQRSGAPDSSVTRVAGAPG